MTLATIRLNLLFLLAVVFHACVTRQQDDHPKQFERFFVQLEAESLKTYPPALDSLDIAIHHLPAGTGDKARYYRIKAGYYHYKEDYKKAFLYLDSLEATINSRLGEKRFSMMQWQQLIIRSECYSALKNYDAAMKCLLQTRTLIDTKGYTEECTGFFLDARIADMLYRQGRFLIAAQQYLKIFEKEKKCFNNPQQVFVNGQRYLDNVGLCYTEAGMPDSAMKYYNATLDYIKAHEATFPKMADFIKLAKAVVYGNMARITAMKNDYEAAEKFSLISIEGTEKDDHGFTLTTRLQLANLYISWGKFEQAEAVLRAIDSSHQLNATGTAEEERMEWNLAMKRLWAKRGDLPKAYAYNDQYLHIRDSLDAIRKRDISRDIGKEFENMEQRAINDKLEVANREKSFQLIIALLAAVLAAAVGLFVWYNLRRSSKHVKELERLNAQIQEKNDDLMQAFSSLEESHAENTRMTRMVAHDLKNPIGGIRTLIYSLMTKGQSDELKRVLELIYTTCTSSINTINDLLKDKGSLALVKKEMVDLRRLMEYCVDLLQTKSEEKKQELHFSGDHIFVPANREKLWRVMSNLLTNAIKFSPEHSIIDIKLERKKGSAILSVKDQGIGIPESLRDKIFMGAPEISRIGTAGEESHGLGLSITQQIVAEHHGRIWFESEENRGCTFYVELPLN